MRAVHSRLLRLLVLAALVAGTSMGMESTREPAELTSLRESYEKGQARRARPLVSQYVDALKKLEHELGGASKLEEALLVREYRVKLSLLQGLGEIDAPPPVENLAGVFIKARAKKLEPMAKTYVDELLKLEKKLSAKGRLKDALAVKKERLSATTKTSVGNNDRGDEDEDMRTLREESVIWWEFEGKSKRIARDSSPAKNDGSLMGVELADDAERGRVASFQDRTDQIRIENIKKFEPESLTVSFWIKGGHANSSLVSYSLVSETNQLLLNFSGGLRYWIAGQALSNPQIKQPSDGWHHLAATYNARNGRGIVYIDGEIKIDSKFKGGAVKGGGILVIGQDQDTFGGGLDPTQSFIGLMDDFIIVPRVLKRVEVAKIFRAQGR